MIKDKPFFLYALCSVTYTGRAKSILEKGKYVIIRKADGTILIHSSKSCKPLNYQPPGSIITIEDNKLIFTRKKEIIEIIIYEKIMYFEINDWSDNQISITMTEADLKRWVIRNIGALLNLTQAQQPIEILDEFLTDVGPVDVLVIDNNGYHYVVELKRDKAVIAACSQLRRYVDYFRGIGKHTNGYLMSPAISKGADRYLKSNGLTWMKVNHPQQIEQLV